MTIVGSVDIVSRFIHGFLGDLTCWSRFFRFPKKVIYSICGLCLAAVFTGSLFPIFSRGFVIILENIHPGGGMPFLGNKPKRRGRRREEVVTKEKGKIKMESKSVKYNTCTREENNGKEMYKRVKRYFLGGRKVIDFVVESNHVG
jgi:hypothetical protein